MAEEKKGKPSNPWEEYETVFVPRMPGFDKQPDITLSVNARVCQVQRGVQVEIAKPFAEVLKRKLAAEVKDEEYFFNQASKNKA